MRKMVATCAMSIALISAWLLGSAESPEAAIGDYARASNFDPTGVTIHCTPTACPIPLVTPWTFKLDTVGSPYDAVVTASFTYQTSKGLRVAAAPTFYTSNTAMTPSHSSRPLPAAAHPRSTTLTWRVPNLDASTTYGLVVNLTPSDGATTYDIAMSNVTLVVEGAQG
jgi:hypothetical protein